MMLALSVSGADKTRLCDYVKPLVGTSGEEGNTYPGPAAPFGMMQLEPLIPAPALLIGVHVRAILMMIR